MNMSDDRAFIIRLDSTRLDGSGRRSGFGSGLRSGTGLRVAIKDLIDMAGLPTTAGCQEVERRAVPAAADASCLAGIRAAEAAGGVRIVGKTNLHELAFGVSGINAAYGTPVNPLDAGRIPGGSSSGSAVAVASGEADIALGTDTGGSIRVPAACCGIVGLKTTWGRVPLQGCWPLSPSLDTIGPMASSVARIVEGMDLLEPGFAIASVGASTPSVIGRLRPPADCDPGVDAAIDAALRASGIESIEVEFPDWPLLQDACLALLLAEAWASDRHLLDRSDNFVSAMTQGRLGAGADVPPAAVAAAHVQRAKSLDALRSLFTRVEALALPSAPMLAPTLEDGPAALIAAYTRPGNLLGTPSLSLPIPVPPQLRVAATAHLPASLQLLGLPGDEERLVRLGAVVEAAVSA